MILLVSLRVLNNFNKPNLELSDILDLVKDLRVTERLLEECNGRGVCFIYGLDEFSPQDKENSQIVNKTYLTVVVASRPAAKKQQSSTQIDDYMVTHPIHLVSFCGHSDHPTSSSL